MYVLFLFITSLFSIFYLISCHKLTLALLLFVRHVLCSGSLLILLILNGRFENLFIYYDFPDHF